MTSLSEVDPAEPDGYSSVSAIPRGFRKAEIPLLDPARRTSALQARAGHTHVQLGNSLGLEARGLARRLDSIAHICLRTV
jgi:hypothetical protein